MTRCGWAQTSTLFAQVDDARIEGAVAFSLWLRYHESSASEGATAERGDHADGGSAEPFADGCDCLH